MLKFPHHAGWPEGRKSRPGCGPVNDDPRRDAAWGRFLRLEPAWTELPQFIKVAAAATISCVGPRRPERPVFIHPVSPDDPELMARHCVQAGSPTGLGPRVHGRARATPFPFRKRLQFDCTTIHALEPGGFWTFRILGLGYAGGTGHHPPNAN